MNAKMQKLCSLCGVFCTIAWLAGFWPLANYFAPHSPTLTGEELLAFYSTNTTVIILGLILLGFGAVLYQPWCSAIAVQMKRIEGEHSPLTWAQLGLGSIFVWVFFLPVMIWIAIAYRPEATSPELILRMSDMAWLCFINPVCIIFFQGLAIGFCVLSDKREQPIFPRWCGFFNIWLVILYLPGSFVPLFKSGPFAWNGLFPWWIPVFLFVTWMVTTTVLLHKAIRRQEEEYNMTETGELPVVGAQAVNA